LARTTIKLSFIYKKSANLYSFNAIKQKNSKQQQKQTVQGGNIPS